MAADKERQKYQELGELGTIAHKAGHRSFGTTPKPPKKRPADGVESSVVSGLQRSILKRRRTIQEGNKATAKEQQRQTETITNFVREQFNKQRGATSSDSSGLREQQLLPLAAKSISREVFVPNVQTTKDK